MALSASDKRDLLMLIGGGVLLAIGSVGFRIIANHRYFGFPRQAFVLQYALGFFFLGLLILLLWQANTEVGHLGLATLTFAIGLGLLYPPASLASITQIGTNVFYLGLVLGGGYLYYQFVDAANTRLIALVALGGVAFYVFGVAYAGLGFLMTGRPVFVITVLILTIILYGFRNILGKELQKTQDESRLARLLGVVLT